MKIYIDVSNLLTTQFITGIQRVVRELITRMHNNTTYNLELISYDEKDEQFFYVDKEAFFKQLEAKKIDRKVCLTKQKANISDFEADSLFFDMDGVWHSTWSRQFLYPLLVDKGVKIVNIIYDVIPITGPIYCHENTVMSFMVYLGAVLEYSSMIIVNAQATKDHIMDIAEELEIEMPECVVVPLGADFGSEKNIKNKDTQIGKATKEAIESGRYILMVGTIEPRKNHKYLLDALDEGLPINVVFAGRQGWNVEELIERIEEHPQKGKKLFWINDASDADISELYENAYYVAFPTFDEGFGLPVIEAIMRGVPVIASDIPVVREVGREYASYVNNKCPSELVDKISKILTDEDCYLLEKNRLKEYRKFTWDDCEKAVENVITIVS